MKVCVYAIAHNEEQFVSRFCEAAQEADLILVADTGSTDNTAEALRIENARHINKAASATIECRYIAVRPWRFDTARDAALALVPDDIDVCLSIDMDEVLQPGWRQELERVWCVGKTTRLKYMFDWGCGIKFWYDKIHARFGYRWKNPVHEFPVPYGIEEEYAWANEKFLFLVHQPDPTKSRGQYLPMLKMSVEEDPSEPRNAFYYARELSFKGHHAESLKECDRYLALPRATWAGERSYAHRVKGRCYTEMGDLKKANVEFLLAVAECPNSREPWCELAQNAYTEKEWAKCLSYALQALSITEREKVYTVDPEVWSHWPHTWAAVAAWNLGLTDLFTTHAKAAFAISPEDGMVQSNHAFAVEK